MGTLTYFVIQNGTKCSEGSRVHKVDVSEILPPYGRLNDKPGEKERYFVILNEVKNLNT